MENIVFNKLANVYYWQNYQGKEIDFIIRENEINKELIQVSFVKDKTDINKREVDNLILGSHILKCNNLSLLTWSIEEKIEQQSKIIKLIPISKFLNES